MDGQAARALKQTSKFGAVLDMVTDRYVSGSLAVLARIADALPLQMHNILPPVLPLRGVPAVDDGVPASHHARLLEPLHAHVQVCCGRGIRGWFGCTDRARAVLWSQVRAATRSSRAMLAES